jgi:hypothetical protein
VYLVVAVAMAGAAWKLVEPAHGIVVEVLSGLACLFGVAELVDLLSTLELHAPVNSVEAQKSSEYTVAGDNCWLRGRNWIEEQSNRVLVWLVAAPVDWGLFVTC